MNDRSADSADLPAASPSASDGPAADDDQRPVDPAADDQSADSGVGVDGDWDDYEIRDAQFRDAQFRDGAAPADASTDHGPDIADEDDEDEAPVRPEPIRLQKVLAAAGVGSRRKSEQLIVQGRVEVDGRIVRELGTRVDPDHAIIRVDGERLNLRADRVYLAFNKPRGVMSTMADEKGRESIATFVEDRDQRLFHVGRLDADSEGLILLTNDGELANRLMHPRYGVGKTYLVQVAAPVPRNLGRALIRGIELEDGIAKADTYDLLDVSGGRALIQLTIHEGRNRIVRRMMDAAGFPVQKLVRTAHGPITLGHLRSGAVRKLTPSELAALYRAVDL